MAWVKIPVQEQWTNTNDVNASGFVIKCYLPGTTTVTPMAIDKNGVTTVTTATLNADGFPEVSGNEVALYIDRDFKIAIYQNASDAAANTNAFWGPVDNIKINSLLSDFQNGYWLADYTELRAIDPADYSADDVITLTDSRIAGDGVLRNVASHGLSDNGGTIIVINSNWYWERINQLGYINVHWFEVAQDSSTDDADAIENADAVAAENNMPLFFPAGSSSYRISRTITRTAQSAWIGSAPMSSYNTNCEVSIYATLADIGDGNPIVRCAPASTQRQSIRFYGIEFISDGDVSASDLSVYTATGLMGVDMSHIKNGLEFVQCSFKSLKIGAGQLSGSPYLDKVTFDKCHFNLCQLAAQGEASGGFNYKDCFIYDCVDWLDHSLCFVDLSGTWFNNSNFSTENCGIVGEVIMMTGGWTEGGNRVFRPEKSCIIKNVYLSETYSAAGSTKFHCLADDNTYFSLEGCRIATNTRIFDTSNVSDMSTLTIEMLGCYNGVNFGSTTSIATNLKNGVNYSGFGNTNASNYNVSRGVYRFVGDSAFTLDYKHNNKIIYHTSGSAHTWTIPANASVPLPIGFRCTIVNENGGGNVSIAITTDTLRFGSSTGTKTVLANECGTLIKVDDTVWRFF